MKVARYAATLLSCGALILAGLVPSSAAEIPDEPEWAAAADEDAPDVSPVITVSADAFWQFTPAQVWSQGPKPTAVEETWTHPLPNARLLSQFGNRGIIPGVTSTAFHNGIDLAAPLGSQILAAGSGVVSYAGHGNKVLGLSGWVVVIEHLDGTSTAYNHMSESGVLVNVGDEVITGDVIALVGSEGRSTGPHLHFSTWVDGEAVNPVNYLQERGVSVPGGRASPDDESTRGNPNDPHLWDWTGAEQGDGPSIEEPYGEPEPDPVEQTPPTPEPPVEPTPADESTPDPTDEPSDPDPTEDPTTDPTDDPTETPEPTPTDEPTDTPTTPGPPSDPEPTPTTVTDPPTP
ncbi:M23 family metallopeptidase [Pseudactinotalea sp.]|uniref:M23 family metallopeptidase n=1 Tax=Pseudactinotalea sp. TaxID=1926260 RepID=UPI003B3A9541